MFEKKIFNYYEAADILCISHNTLRKWVSDKKLVKGEHFIKLGSAVRFNEDQISKLISGGV